uniref:Serine/threonine-protein kinase PknK n=1 Tax=Vitiosangium cumulatum TaxID=1867796 RepID=A0A7D5BG99_9BACT|nr:serine/threonine-protein kinase PknK [Vitiosangium cumulatum]
MMQQVHTPAAPALPESIGPYRVLDVLGQGGMGVVYRGEHRETGEAVALKTVRVASSVMLASIRREIHALRRMHHPGVVRIVAEGVWDGLPWCAMELLSGRTLRGVIDARPSLVATLTLLRRLCAPLAFLHGNGLVHRDLKPENVFIRPDGGPVLVDFGIAAQSGGAREVLQVGGSVVGSEAYMAPEQIRGDFVDARTDLYALGCILYEAVTGQPPFVASRSAGGVLHQHLRRQPLPPSRVVEGLPPELDALVSRLLAKRPQERLGYAEDVAAALTALGAGAEEPDTPRPAPYLYRPDFSGRGEVLERLARALEEASRGHGGCVFIGGESGVGKTRLAMELATEATYRRLAVVTGECVPLGVGGGSEVRAAPLHPFRPLLLAVADRCREHGAEETERLLGPRGKVLAAYEPTLARLPGQEAQPEPPPLPPQQARARVLKSLRDTLLALARAQPLLLVLDDLQWADELSLSFLQELTPEHLRAHGVLVVGTYRLDEASGALRRLVQAPGGMDLELERLEAASIRDMVRGMLALREAPESFLDTLVTHASGNPFFIAEYLRAAIGEGLLSRTTTGEWRLGVPGERAGALVLPLPRSIAELIERRLAELGEDGRALVQLAAVLGREFDGELLSGAAALGDEATLEALEELRLRQVLEEAGEGRLRFVHDKLREVAYGRIPAERRGALHHRAAEAVERRHASELPRHAATLAHHWSQAGVHGRASRFFALAGDQARAAYANDEAIAFYEAALRQASHQRSPGAFSQDAGTFSQDAEPLALERVYESLGDVRALTGRQAEAREAYAQALARLSLNERVRRASIHRRAGKSWETHHQHEEALRAYAAAEAALEAGPGELPEDVWQEWFQIQNERITTYYWQARVREMTELVERVRPIVEARGAPLQRARFFQSLVQMRCRTERYRVSDETVVYARALVRASQESQVASELSLARFVMATTLLFHDALAESEALIHDALAEAERMGDVTLQARCLTFLTMLQRRQGRVEETRRQASRCLEVSTAANMADYIGAAHANLGWVAWREGLSAKAEHHARTALRCWQPLSLVYPFQWMAHWPLLAIELERHRLTEALGHVRALLDPAQQRMPDELTGPLEHAPDGEQPPPSASGPGWPRCSKRLAGSAISRDPRSACSSPRSSRGFPGTSTMPHPKHPNTVFYISPATTHDGGGGIPRFKLTLLEGFSTRVSAHVIDPDTGKPTDITEKVKWKPLPVMGSGGHFIKEWQGSELHLKGRSKGHARLQATHQKYSLEVDVEILESDMLLYAPDGFVYRIPTEVWTRPKAIDPKDPNPKKVVRYHPERLPDHIQGMLRNDVTLANVPSGVTMPAPSQKSNDSSDNITCFLLNLNSLALSYSPQAPVPPPASSRSKPAAKAKTTPARRKRG